MRQVSPSYGTGPRAHRSEATGTQHPAPRRPEPTWGRRQPPHTAPPSAPPALLSRRRSLPPPLNGRNCRRRGPARGGRGAWPARGAWPPSEAPWRGAATAAVTSDPARRWPIRARLVPEPKISTSAKVKMERGGARRADGAVVAGRDARPHRGGRRGAPAERGGPVALGGAADRCAAAEGGVAPARREGPGPAARQGAAGAEGRRPCRALSAGAGRRRGAGAAGSAAAPRGAFRRAPPLAKGFLRFPNRALFLLQEGSPAARARGRSGLLKQSSVTLRLWLR